MSELALPIGTVTFLLTDVEGSTTGWQAAPTAMGRAIARHYEILDAAVAAHGGVRPQEQGEGDSIVAAFGRASDAVLAAVDAEQALTRETWPEGLAAPLRVRMAVHTGEAQLRDEANYVGQAIIRTARLRAIAHGGQVLVSQAVRDLVIDQLGGRIELVDLGTHRLKDLARPERVWQVAGPDLDRDFPPLKSLDALPNNLPIELSTFVGRQPEIETVCALSIANRLVTITGTGGAGKTRLAQQVAAHLIDAHPDGTWWIELAPVDADDVTGTMAAVLSISDPSRLVERLAGRILLVLDNCEHVLDAIAPLAHKILTACPDASILATSRGPLDIPGEVTWRVPPLTIPASHDALPIDRLVQYDAVQLFVDRARRARPNFTLTTSNGPAIAELCSRLDGIPLAIELAAARTKSLTAEQILSSLDDSLRLLTGGSRLVMPRQQTLEASIQWSHNLLGPQEQTLLRRLSIFAGGWNLEAAEHICADDALPSMSVLDCLEHLIDQSLVRVDEHGNTARYTLLETVRQYAARQLAEREDELARNSLASRHAQWYAHVADEAFSAMETTHYDDAVDAMTPERDNLLGAMRHLHAQGDVQGLAAIVLSCKQYWGAINAPAQGRTWATHALDLLGDHHDELRAPLFMARSDWDMLTGPIRHTRDDMNTALAIAERIGDRRTAGRARVALARQVGRTDPAAAAKLLGQALDDARASGDRFTEANATSMPNTIHGVRGDLRALRASLAASESIIRSVGGVLLLGWNMTRSIVANYEADHPRMRTAIDPNSAEFIGIRDFGVGFVMMIEMALAADLGDVGPSPEHIEERITHYLRTENYGVAVTLIVLRIRALRLRGRDREALAACDAAAHRVPSPSWPIAGAMSALAIGDIEGARSRLAQAPGRDQLGIALSFEADLAAALLARHDDELSTAETVAHQSLALAVEHGYAREILDLLEVLAVLAAVQGSWAHAARLAGAAQHQRDTHPLKGCVEPIRSMHEAELAAARTALGDDAYDAALAEGAGLTRDDAVAYAQRMRGERARPTLGWASLTPTERRVVDLARAGRSNPEIGRELLMGVETVKTHLSRVYAKLGVTNRTQLASATPPTDN